MSMKGDMVSVVGCKSTEYASILYENCTGCWGCVFYYNIFEICFRNESKSFNSFFMNEKNL